MEIQKSIRMGQYNDRNEKQKEDTIMALAHTQGYKDNRKEGAIFTIAETLIKTKDRLKGAKASLLTTTAAIQADANAGVDLKTMAMSASNFINNAKVTDFISFVESNLE